MKYAKALVHVLGAGGATTTAVALPAPYNLWVSVGIALVSLAGVIRIPNRSTTVGELEDDVRQIVSTIREATPPAPPTAPPSPLAAALAILTPPAS